MNILLDTSIFLWLLNDDPLLPCQARALYLDGENDFYLSSASLWEIIIKCQIGKLKLPTPVDDFLEAQLKQNAFRLLPVQKKHLFKLPVLPLLRKDPFDRLIIATALSENLPVLTSDKIFKKYGVENLP